MKKPSVLGKISPLEGRYEDHSAEPKLLDGRGRLEPVGSRRRSMGLLFFEFCRGGGETSRRAVDEMNMIASDA